MTPVKITGTSFHRQTKITAEIITKGQQQGPRDWQNSFARTRFRYIEVLFHIFYCYWGKENCSLSEESDNLALLYRVPLTSGLRVGFSSNMA